METATAETTVLSRVKDKARIGMKEKDTLHGAQVQCLECIVSGGEYHVEQWP